MIDPKEAASHVDAQINAYVQRINAAKSAKAQLDQEIVLLNGAIQALQGLNLGSLIKEVEEKFEEVVPGGKL